mgnify:FL=1
MELQRRPTKRFGFIIGEFDGAILEVNKKKLTLDILEAKKNTVNYSYARKQLSRIKRYLKPQYRKGGLVRIQRIETGGKSAFLRIRLS